MLDRGTKIYAAVLSALVLALVFAAEYQPSKVRELNRQLAADAQLASYPYPFRVLRIEGKTAVMASPRSADMPVQRMIGALDPSLARRAGDDPDFLRAQQQLADRQAQARALVLADAAIESVRWELDTDWLRRHGIQVP
jgi:hypothetical protein